MPSLCSLSLAWLWRPVSAQYRPPAPLPEPVPSPEPMPTPTPTDDTLPPVVEGPETTRRAGWSWQPGFVLDGTYEQNVGFTRPPGPDDVFGALTASLARIRRTARTDFRVSLLSGDYSFAHTDSEGTLLESGVLLPLARTKTAGAATGLTWRPAERTSLSVDGGCLRVGFDFAWAEDDISTRRVKVRNDRASVSFVHDEAAR